MDQNGYLVGGKLFADRLSTRYDPINPATGKVDPFMFVGAMWIGVDFGLPTERYYPKYPIGMPVLVAVAQWIGSTEQWPIVGPMVRSMFAPADAGAVLTYLINPIFMTAAMLGSFVLFRLFAGSFAAVIGMILLMTGPNVVSHTNNPNSHATTLFCTTWGMFLLLRWWQAGGAWRAAGAGFLLGYAVTIRYTEGLLCSAIALAVLYRVGPQLLPMLAWLPRKVTHDLSELLDLIRARKQVPIPIQGVWLRALAGTGSEAPARPRDWFDRGPWLQTILMGCAWALPIAVLVTHNLVQFGALTGYDPSNESVGFSWDYFDENWETLLRHMNSIGLFLLFPLGVAGLVWMFAVSWRAASMMAAWILPTCMIYALYYWAPDGTHVGYLRFFLTIFPGVVACALFLLYAVLQSSASSPLKWQGRQGNLFAVMIGVIGAMGIVFNLEQSLISLENEQRGNSMLHRAVEVARAIDPQSVIGKPKGTKGDVVIPAGSVVFSHDHMLDHLQFAGDWVCYSFDPFNHSWVRRHAKTDPDEPQVFQPQRARFLYDLLKNNSEEDFVKLQQEKIAELLLGGEKKDPRRVFFILPANGVGAARLRLAARELRPKYQFECKIVATWNDPNVNPYRKPATPQPRRQKFEPPALDPKQTVWNIMEVKLR